jgi:hypothetical protein
MGLGEWHPGQRFGSGRGLADHFDVFVALEQAPDALSHQLVVIEQEDPDTHVIIVPVLTAGLRKSSE